MATIKIYSDIQSENEKAAMRFFGGVEGVSYNDINDFLANIPENDNAIDIRLHCNGGSVTEGWAMYDALRATGKEITATVEGTCASMATIILMAAPKERRKAYENAHILLHNPYMMTYALGETATADELEQAGEELKAEQTRMVDLYVERCGCDRAELVSLMDKDTFIDTDEALRLGVIGHVIPPISASAKPKSMNMSDNLLSKMMRKLGFKSEEEAAEALKGLDLNTADGQILTVDRKDGAPQVGDAANPDGEWLMPDGTTIIVENGYIVEIREADAPLDEATDEQKGERADPEPVAEIIEEIIEEPDREDDEVRRLRERVDELEARVAELEAENAELRLRLEEANAKAKTEDDEKILNAVALAGGVDALAMIQSNYKPEARQPQGARVSDIVTADDIIARQKKAYNRK